MVRVIWSTQPTKSFWDLQPRLSGGDSALRLRARTSTSDDLKTRLVARPAGPTRPLRAPRDPTVVVGAVELVKAGIPNLGGQPFSASESGVNFYDIRPGRRVSPERAVSTIPRDHRVGSRSLKVLCVLLPQPRH